MGYNSCISCIASLAWSPASLSSSSPVPTVKANISNIIFLGSKPCLSTANLYILLAISTFLVAVLAIPSSSITKQTNTAPYFFAKAQYSPNFSSPSSRLVELIMGLPPIHFSASSIVLALVASGIRGSGIFWLYSSITALMSLAPSRPANSTLTSRQ